MNLIQLDLLQRDWCDDAAADLGRWLKHGETFTADDLHKCLVSPPQPNWFGVLTAKLKRMGLAEPVGWQKSSRPSRNGAAVRVWRRL